MKKGKLIVGIMAVCIFFSVSALDCACAADVIELKASSWLPTQHPVNQQVYIPWGKLVEERTKGRVKLTWFLDGSLVKNEQTLSAVKGGMVDIVAPVSIWFFDKQFPATSAIFLPFQVDSEAHGSQSYYEAYRQIEAVRNECKGMKMLGFQTSGIANFHTKGFSVKAPEDFKGKRIWPANSIGMQALKLWGAAPTLVKMADIYTSLQRGTLDGVLFPSPPLSDFRFTDILNNHLYCTFCPGAQAVAMNQAKWDSLPPDIQKVFEELVLPLSIAIGKKFMEMNDFVISELKKRGDTVIMLTSEQKVEWKGTLKSIYGAQVDDMKNAGLDGQAIMNKIQSIIEDARKKPYEVDQNWKAVQK